MEFTGKKGLVAGSGVSGIAAAELLRQKEIEFVLFDANKDLDVEALRARAPVFADTDIIAGELTDSDLAGIDFAVVSPGIPSDSAAINVIRARQIPIIGEIELAFLFSKGRIAAITGTNGKTTTTALTGEILKSHYSDVKVVGNIGIPYTSVAAQTTDESVIVAEISSFQLETIQDFAPDVSAILNITPDHLDRHHTMECYIKTKESITKNQKPGSVCVLNYEDEVLREFGSLAGINVLCFSSRRVLEQGLYLDGNQICYADGNRIHTIIHTDELNILGVHNYENAMAASAIAISFGVPLEKITEVLKHFQAVEHRIEYVAEIDGVRYYNDSKGTNPDAAIKGIQAMSRPTYLIGGGYDKQAGYDEWIESFDGKVKQLLLIGQTKEKIAKSAREHGFHDIVFCDSLKEAVELAGANASEGEAVLLSPACASWGMFKNYEERGRMFKEYVTGQQKKE